MTQLRQPSNVVSTPDSTQPTVRVIVRENSRNIKTNKFSPPDNVEDPQELKKHLTQLSAQLEKLQQELKDQTEPLRSHRPLFGNMFIDQQFQSGVNLKIQHGLGRAYSGWRLSRVRVADAVVFEPINSTGSPVTDYEPTSRLILTPGSTFTADIEIW